MFSWSHCSNASLFNAQFIQPSHFDTISTLYTLDATFTIEPVYRPPPPPSTPQPPRRPTPPPRGPTPPPSYHTDSDETCASCASEYNPY